MNEIEKWLPIPWLAGSYEVSSLGRVKSLERYTKCGTKGIRLNPQKILKPCPNTQGYLQVNLPVPGGKFKAFRVHRLVLETFVGPRPDEMEACHSNGVRTDNRLSNLRWDTRKANHQDKRTHNTILVGERSCNSKLTDQQALSIRAEYNNNPRELSQKYKVSRETIRRIVNNCRYAHLTSCDHQRP